MGKLHGLCVGLDICSTLHMDVSLDDLDWCIEHVMPANPAYLMALPTKNDPMLSYLTTSFSDHVRIREQFGYKVNDAMWDFFKRIGVIDANGKPTKYFGQPLWVYYQYRLAKGDTRSIDEIYEEGRRYIAEIEARGVPIAQGHGQNYWDPPAALHERIRYLYQDAKESLWTELESDDIKAIPRALSLGTLAKDRKDYVYHPESGERLHPSSIAKLQDLRASWADDVPDVQVVISDGLNVRSLTDDGHLMPFLNALEELLKARDLNLSNRNLVVTNGRVRAGYMIGEILYGTQDIFSDTEATDKPKGIVHIIGERPGTGHHNFSVYLTTQPSQVWGVVGKVDHDVTRVVSGISDTAFHPTEAARETAMIYDKLLRVHATRQTSP
jgi:ethanolamine ammonia-lyase large subunit